MFNKEMFSWCWFLLSKNRKFNTNNVCKLHLCIAVRYCGMFFASPTHSNKWWNRWNLRVPPAAVLSGGCWRLNLSDLDSFPSSLYSAGLCSSWEKVSPSIKISNIFDHQILFALEVSHAALIWINSRPRVWIENIALKEPYDSVFCKQRPKRLDWDQK